MTDSLDVIKSRVRERFIGREGVHGVGIRRAEQAICVYLDQDCEETAALRGLISEIERDATPFRVIVVREQKPLARK